MDNTSAPLADYFWIAGIDSLSYNDFQQPISPNITPNQPSVDAIEEGCEYESITESIKHGSGTPHSRKSSINRLSKRNSNIQECDDSDMMGSNRSSMTIKAPPNSYTSGGILNEGNNGLTDFDFDRALRTFAMEREHFLDDLSFRAGAQLQEPPPMTELPLSPKVTARTRSSDSEYMSSFLHSNKKNSLRSVGGSIRRHISFRDMNSMKKQPSILQRNVSIRTTRRLSGYNSVIPPPEPLNADPEMHPLKRRFEPVLLDRYPPKTATKEVERRGRFPDYVPMFAFPNDINIVSADERPRSTWHGFAMTLDDATKIYGITIIVWMPVNADAAENLERRCEEWRQSHMTNEERELAASLAERLASERAHLSQLLAKLPSMISGSISRDALEEQISTVEEKIGLMTDLLRPVRHGAASKIDGLTDGETGLWIPRAYGILGRDGSLTSFWKEWLKAIIVPMTDGGVLRVPPSSPKVGRWQPLERYVVNLCTEALSPMGSKTQVELAVRDLKLFARKEAPNELPDSRNTDLYALFRSLSIPNIVSLFEFALSESRIILLSSHTSMLHLASAALANLLYPFKWASIFIPVLPARLLSALEAPCPYIVGIERRYENIELPEDDYVLVDLDQNTIEASASPVTLPRQLRRKLVSLLQYAAPHHNRCGVPFGPPPYAIESFPYNAFSSENDAIFTQHPPRSTFAKYISQSSSAFGDPDSTSAKRSFVFNAFLQSKNDHGRSERPSTSKSSQTSPPSSVSPISGSFPTLPPTPGSKNDSGFALTATLREKRSGHFDMNSRRSSSFGIERQSTLRKPSIPFNHGHHASLSTSALSVDAKSMYGYAPSSYAVSTLAASTVLPNILMQPVHNSELNIWVEGHCFELNPSVTSFVCTICDEKAETDGIYQCNHCGTFSHGRCLGMVSLVCTAAFYPDKVRAAFVRCFASLFYTYRKFLMKPGKTEKNCEPLLFKFDMNGFIKSLPSDQHTYMNMLKHTQALNEFIHVRETTPPSSPSIQLFDSVIMAKRNRGRASLSLFSKNKQSYFLHNQMEHLWRSAAVPIPTAKFPGDYHAVVSRIPAKLDISLMREPRAIQGAPRVDVGGKGRRVGRKAVPSILGGSGRDLVDIEDERVG